MATPSLTITTTQRFSRRALGFLWEKRTEFDDGTREFINRLYNNRTKSSLQGEQTITYKHSAKSKAGKAGYGRIYGTCSSLEFLQADCRATLCSDLYHDLDIANAHPCLLVQIAERCGVAIPLLKHYVGHREAVLEGLGAVLEVDRTSMKDKIIAMVFGSWSDVDVLGPMIKELRTVAKTLSQMTEFVEIFELTRTDDNHLGKFLAAILQTEECRCLVVIRDALIAAGWSPDVLVYDGLMIQRRTDVPEVPADLLRQVEAAVFSATGYRITMTEKPMVGFAVPVAVDSEDQAYDAMKTLFEETHFYFVPTNTIAEVSPKGVAQMSLEHANVALNTWLLPKQPSMIEAPLFIKRWIKDPKRRMVNSLVYKMPGDCLPNEASLFNGFAYKQMEGQDDAAIMLFRDLVSSGMGDEEPVVDYAMKYFAHMIQKPFEIPGTAIIMSSHRHGTGKDTLVNCMASIIGSHAVHYNSETQFWDKHDTKKEGAILIHLEEACARANKAKSSELKALITADRIDMNPKGIKAYDVPNVARIIMTTNEADPVNLEESDRRFLIVNPSNRLLTADWIAIYSQIKTPAFIATVGRYLETLSLDGWNPRKLPMTAIKAGLLDLSKPVELEFIEQLDNGPWKSAAGLYDAYRKWYIGEGYDARFMRISANSLGKALLPYVGDGRLLKRKTKIGPQYSTPAVTPVIQSSQ